MGARYHLKKFPESKHNMPGAHSSWCSMGGLTSLGLSKHSNARVSKVHGRRLLDIKVSTWPRKPMRNLRSPNSIKLKALLFLFLGLFSSALLLLYAPMLRVFVLLILAIWSFCRFYYFAFYVIEHYIDPSFRFSGLFSVAHYLLSQERNKQNERPPSGTPR